jgi:hypothetical protein
MWNHVTTAERVGFVVAVMLSVGWLVLIIVERSWWQLPIWVIVLPLGPGGWLARGFVVAKSEKAHVEQSPESE